MPAAVDIRPVRPGDAQALVAAMRPQDVAECRASGHDDILSAVELSIAHSAQCWSAEADGVLLCIFGVAPVGTVLAPRGAPWLLGTDAMQRRRRALVALTRPYIVHMLALYPHLANFVHARNTLAVRWLQRIGFTLHAAIALPGTGEPFHPFEMKG